MSDSDSPAPDAMSLDDGRNLSWYEFGDRSGAPCLFLPGSASSGLAGAALHAAAKTGGVRLVCVDRPGLGHSDPAPRRPLVDWARDVNQLADHLMLTRFGLLGHSAGGAYALAVACRLPERVSCTVIGAGSPPYAESWTRADGVVSRTTRLYNGLANHAPRLFGALYQLSAPRSSKSVDRLVALAARGSSPDAEFARNHPGETRAAIEALGDGFRQGSSGPVNDVAALSRPWGFDLGEVSAPVEWWHGEQDSTVSARAGREVISHLPAVTPHFVHGGHYALFAYATQVMRPFHQSSA